jgi:hypothetical protein
VPPYVDTKEREQRGRIELGSHGEAQERKCERRAPAEQGGHRTRHEQCRPAVVGVQRHRSQRERCQGERSERAVQPPGTRSQPHKDQRRKDEGREPDQRHQHLERVAVRLLRQQGGRSQDHKRAGRILDEDVTVGQSSVKEPLRVFPVEAHVPILPAAEQTSLRDGSR